MRLGVGLGAHFAVEVGASVSPTPTFLGAWILRLPMTRGLAVHLAGAVARGRYVSYDPGADYADHVYEPAIWSMVELGLEH